MNVNVVWLMPPVHGWFCIVSPCDRGSDVIGSVESELMNHRTYAVVILCLILWDYFDPAG